MGEKNVPFCADDFKPIWQHIYPVTRPKQMLVWLYCFCNLHM